MSGGLSLTERLEQMVSKKVREIKYGFKWHKIGDFKNWSNYKYGNMDIFGFKMHRKSKKSFGSKFKI